LEYLFGGFNFRLPKPGANKKEGIVHANLELLGLTIRYSEDVSEPDINSKVYSGPIPFKVKVKLRAFSLSEKGEGISEIR
jgi:hexosaminidase